MWCEKGAHPLQSLNHPTPRRSTGSGLSDYGALRNITISALRRWDDIGSRAAVVSFRKIQSTICIYRMLENATVVYQANLRTGKICGGMSWVFLPTPQTASSLLHTHLQQEQYNETTLHIR